MKNKKYFERLDFNLFFCYWASSYMVIIETHLAINQISKPYIKSRRLSIQFGNIILRADKHNQ